MRTSYSAIETYLQCPQRYKFQELDRIRAPKSREAIFGTLIHETLKFMFTANPLFPTLDEVIAHFREQWPEPDAFNAESKNDTHKRAWNDVELKAYFEDGVRMLKKFYEKNAPWNFSVLDLESRFEVVLEDEKTGQTHILAGIIDRIDKTSDSAYEIIDYKTARRMPSQDAINENLQLSLYSLGLRKRWPHIKPEEIRLSLYFLRHGEKLSTTPAPETAEKTREHILETIREIQDRMQQNKEFEPMPSPLCDWCGYRPICPAWKHRYRNTEKNAAPGKEEMDGIIEKYFALKKSAKEEDKIVTELLGEIKRYMEREGLTRVFGAAGTISKKTTRRYAYDMEKIKSLLSPLGKWEAILDADEKKLAGILHEIPEAIRKEIEQARMVSKEYETFTASFNKKSGDDGPDED